MENQYNRTLIESQKWKFWFFAALILFSGLGFVIPERLAFIFSVDIIIVKLVTVLVVFLALTGAILSIRCQRCGLRLVWFALTKKDIGGWLNWLLKIQSCPRCQFYIDQNYSQNSQN